MLKMVFGGLATQRESAENQPPQSSSQLQPTGIETATNQQIPNSYGENIYSTRLSLSLSRSLEHCSTRLPDKKGYFPGNLRFSSVQD